MKGFNKMMNNKSRNMMFSALLIGSLISSMLQTSLTTALPAIMSDFSVLATTAQWLTSAYSLAMGIMIPATAFLLKRFKTKTLFLVAMGMFGLGVLLSAIASSFYILLLGRILQALGNGLLLAMVQVVILTIYPANRRGFVMGIYGLAVGVAPIFSPTLTGIIVDLFNWRIIFWVVFAISILNICFGYFAVKNVLETEKKPFDMLSMSLSAIGLSSLLFGLGNLGIESFLGSKTGFPILVGIFVLIIFVMRQQHMKEPFLMLSTLKNIEYRLAVIISMILYAVLISSSILIPMFIQIVQGLSATMSGLILMPGALAMAVISPFTGIIYDKFGIRKLTIVGSFFLVVGSVAICFADENTSVFYLAIVQMLRSISVGCIMMPIVTWGMSTLDNKYTSHGTALLTSLRTIAGSIGSAILVALMTLATNLTSANVGTTANVFGMNVVFISASVLAILQLIIAVLFVGKNNYKINSNSAQL